jgi:phosphatidylethanolamine-binding protein (PEBP) family uncharacterized protein
MRERLTGAALVAALLLSGCATAGRGGKLGVSINDTAWDGTRIPDGMQCAQQGGTQPASPPLLVSGIPASANRLVVEFNDESYAPLSADGGHGKFSINVAGRDEVIVPPFGEGQTNEWPTGVSMVASNRSGRLPGYLAPCSGKQNHLYSVIVRAMSPSNDELARGYLPLGRY